MSQELLIADFDKLSNYPERWNHNINYFKLLLNNLPKERRKALDVGCGKGELTRILVDYFNEVVGVDISSGMISAAKQKAANRRIRYVLGDIEKIKIDETFDLIVSIATFHHLDYFLIIPKLKKMLNPNGVMLIIDIYKRKGFYDLFLDVFAAIFNTFMRIFFERQKETKEEITLIKQHCKLDNYLSIKQLNTIYKRTLGVFYIKKLLLWRYFANRLLTNSFLKVS